MRLFACCVALVMFSGCKKEEEKPTASPKDERAAVAKKKPAINKVCGLLQAPDFEAVGLTYGTPAGDGSMGGGACTWTPALGKGGFLHLELITQAQYEQRRERAGDKAVSISGLGDEAFLAPAVGGEGIQVKAAGKYFRIDGNARLNREKLEPLARAVRSRL